MRSLRVWWRRLAGVFDGERRDRELAGEIESHLQLHVDDNIRAGMTPDEARRQAILALGGVEQAKERYRDRRGFPSGEALFRDIRLAVRTLARRKVLLAATTLSIGIGAGINISVYAVLRNVLFSGWVHGAAEPDRLVTIQPGLSYPNYQDLLRQDTLVDTAALQASTLIWRSPTGTTGLGGRVVSENFFDIARPAAFLGRPFAATDQASDRNTDRVVVSFGFWKRRLGADPAIIGRSLNLNGWPYTIVAVLPSGFAAPVGPMIEPAVYVPIGPHNNVGLNNRAAAQFDLLGRLHDGVTQEQALVSLGAAGQQLESVFPEINRGLERAFRLFDGTMSPVGLMLQEAPQGRVVLTLAATVYALVGLVLLIACANVAGLLSARADERRHEIAVRTALGATRSRLTQQFLAESLVVSALGCAVGAALWQTCATLLPKMPVIVDTGIEIVPGSLPLVYALGLIFVVTAACGLAPAVAASQIAPVAGLKAARGGHGFRRIRLQHTLVSTQVGFAVVLLTIASTLLHTFLLLRAVEPGYDVTHTLEIAVRLPPGQGVTKVTPVKEAIEHLPGVEAVSYGDLPLFLLARNAAMRRTGDDTPLPVDLQLVGPGYLATMRIPLNSGRDLLGTDVEQPTSVETPIVVNETFVRLYHAGIGESFALEGDTDSGRPARRVRVAGVARDVKIRSLGGEPVAIVYLPTISPSLVVRVAGSGSGALRMLEQLAGDRLPGALVTGTAMSDRLSTALLPSRISALLLSLLGGVGLALAMIGLHGIVAYTVSQRTFEIGLRTALGATRSAVVWLILQRSIVSVGAGCLAGVAVALVVVRLLRPLLAAGQSTVDPLVIGGVIAMLALAVGLASWWPARRAARVDPIIALRSE